MNFEDIVLNAIVFNREHREKNKEMYLKKAFHPIEYAMQLSTVHINIGRGVGKTQFIRKYANPYDVIVVPKGSMKILFRDCECRNIFTPFECRHVIYRDADKPKTIWMDEIGFATEEEIYWVYNTFIIDDEEINQTWVRLGI